MLLDYFKLAIENITHRKLRAWLTILGIVVGIAAVVALVSLGRGLQYTVDEQFSKIGMDKVTISAKSITGGPGSYAGSAKLSEEDLRVVKRTIGVDSAVAIVQKTSGVEFNRKQEYAMIRGVPVAEDERKIWEETGMYDVQVGRTLKNGDSNKVVIGPEFAKETTYGREIKVDDKIIINGRQFTVIGIIKTGGNPGVSSVVMMTLDDIRELYGNPNEISAIMVKVDDATVIDDTIKTIEKDLRRSRNVKEGQEDFTVQSTKSMVESYLTVFNVISVLLIGLASISILVGAIGITNTMYTAVLERRREIGVMKAIGATNAQVLTIFLIESSIIGLLGGIIGMAIGVGMALIAQQLIGLFLGEGFFQVFLPWWLLVGAAAFAMIVGVIAGVFPAKQASEMHPVEALRG